MIYYDNVKLETHHIQVVNDLLTTIQSSAGLVDTVPVCDLTIFLC